MEDESAAGLRLRCQFARLQDETGKRIFDADGAYWRVNSAPLVPPADPALCPICASTWFVAEMSRVNLSLLKDDRRGARVLADALRTDPQAFRSVSLPDPLLLRTLASTRASPRN